MMPGLTFEWEDVNTVSNENGIVNTKRAKVIGGWLIKVSESVYPQDYQCFTNLIFVPDQAHHWKINKGVSG